MDLLASLLAPSRRLGRPSVVSAPVAGALHHLASAALEAVEGAVVVLANLPRRTPRRYRDYPSYDLLKAHQIAGHVRDGDAVLDIGCGNGHVLDELGLFREVRRVGIDLAPRVHRAGVDVRAFDGRAVPFPDATFDVSLLCYVLHHLERDRARALLEEALRVTRRTVILLEDSLPRFDRLYRLRNRLHRVAKDLEYGAASTAYRPLRDEAMFLTHDGWRELLGSLTPAVDVEVRPLGDLCRYAHHTMIVAHRRR